MGNLKSGFVSGMLGIVLFGIAYAFNFWGFHGYAAILVSPFYSLPPVGLFYLMRRKRKPLPPVVGAAPLPKTMKSESAIEEYQRLKNESPSDRLKKQSQTTIVEAPSEPKPPTQSVTAVPKDAPPTGYCVKCKAWRAIVDPKNATLKNGRAVVKGDCPACSTQVFTFASMNGHSDNEVPIPFKIIVAGVEHEYEFPTTATEMITRGRRKGV